MRTVLILILSVSVFLNAQQLKYNYMEDSWQFARKDDELKYNYMEDRWELSQPSEQLRYNYLDDTWQYVEPED